jgi:hypothetical protein
MKVKAMLAVAALSYAPLGLAGNKAACPKENVAQFVVEKLDVTSLPSAMRPRKEKGKKTFADYGFATESVGETEAMVQAVGGATGLSIKVLYEGPSGIYVCMAAREGGEAKKQSVVFLKRKDSSALLKGRESWREFASCPVIGGSGNDSDASGY